MKNHNSPPAIVFNSVSKSFLDWEQRPTSIKAMVSDMLSFRFQPWKAQKREVLSNLSLEIYPGEFVGIMGRNGVGKSTMLRLISRIYTPTSGTVETRGRVAPLLELGAGFASELTGYENIFLNASILGFSRREIEQKIDTIVSFSELGDFIRAPVRNYSMGMLVRLGFSIAAHLESEILLFDEVLAVGDIGFQTKCLKKISELHQQKRTIVLVTHDPSQIQRNCTRCIVVEKNRVAYDGSPDMGTQTYRELFV